MAKQGPQPGRVRSSIVRRLNMRLFFRLAGIYLCMDLLLTALFAGGLFFWAERQCGEIGALVEERGVPSAEATAWMEAGDYIVCAGTYQGDGWRLPRHRAGRNGLPEGERWFNPGDLSLFFGLVRFHTELGTTYSAAVDGASPYVITLDLSKPVAIFALVSRILLLCQVISLIANLLRNAGTIRKVLRPIQDLAAAAARLGSSSDMSPEELRTLAGKLDEINEAHLDRRISVSSDQKELSALADAINAMLERIDQAYQSQKRFVSDASHELRTPIAVIQGYANLLDRWGKDNPAARQESIDAIRTEAEAMKSLIEQLLFLARGDNHSTQLHPEPVELTAIAGTVLKEAQMIDQSHPFAGNWTEAVELTADPGLLKQALRVLVDNSIKYTPAGGTISVAVTRSGPNARISVQDEGQGIDGEALPHIFERFYRTDESRARQTGGAGLGLSIAKWIVDRHGGWFEVTSRPGLGTDVTMIFPLAQGAAP